MHTTFTMQIIDIFYNLMVCLDLVKNTMQGIKITVIDHGKYLIIFKPPLTIDISVPGVVQLC